MSDETKWCPGCRSHKPLDEWHRHSGTKDGLQYRCKQCQNALVATARQRRRRAEKRALRRVVAEHPEVFEPLLHEELSRVRLR